jgi:hypothetical protein
MLNLRRTIGLAELKLGKSPVTIKQIKDGESYSFTNTIVENLEITQDSGCGCYRLSGQEQLHKFMWAGLHSEEIRDPKIIETVEEGFVKEHHGRGWFSPPNYKYVRGWVRLKERKPFSATLCGELLIID